MRVLARRLIAFVLDWIVLFAVLAAPQFLLMLLTGTWFLDAESSNVLTWAWVGVSITLPSLAYFAYCDQSRSGQTIGKRLIGVWVRPSDGDRLSPGQALSRNVVKLIPWEATHIMIFFPEPFSDGSLSAGKIVLMVLADVLFIVWLVYPIFDRQCGRALHDHVAHTVVVPSGMSRAV